MIIWGLLAFVTGSVVGSFLGALTYRLPKGISIVKGRSKCPKCHKTIRWYDNIPVVSFMVLHGRCRSCKNKISIREPLIEIGTALTFLLSFMEMDRILANTQWLNSPTAISFGLVLVFMIIMLAIFVIDIEHQLILDEFVFFGLLILVAAFLIFDTKEIFTYLFAGISASLFLLFINFVTRGRGMGLGDVKFALLAGTFLGFPNVIIWLFLGFILGGLLGIVLIILGKAKLSQKIAFGPFLVISFFITLLFGSSISATIIPYGFWVF